jgi:multidrug transporter EmrE-like cation transporter
MQLFLMFALAVGANAIGTILIKIGTGKIGDISFSLSSAADILKNIYILGGILLYAISFPAYNYILQKLNVSVAFPIFMSASFATVVIISFFFLKESVSILQAAGLLLVIGGIVLLARG